MKSGVFLYKFRPDTYESAEDFSQHLSRLGILLSLRARLGLWWMRRRGAQFYWKYDGGRRAWDRVELVNFVFVSFATGEKVTLIHQGRPTFKKSEVEQ